MPGLIAVSEFVEETREDYNSPTTSTFVSRMPQCRQTITSLEEVRTNLYFSLSFSISPSFFFLLFRRSFSSFLLIFLSSPLFLFLVYGFFLPSPGSFLSFVCPPSLPFLALLRCWSYPFYFPSAIINPFLFFNFFFFFYLLVP